MQVEGLNIIPLIGIIIVLACYIILVTYKNYMKISGEHMGVMLMGWIVAKALQISATLIVIYWRSVLFEGILTATSGYGLNGIVTQIGDVGIAVMVVYMFMLIPEAFLKIIVGRHKKRDRQASAGRRLMDLTYY